MTKSQIAIIGSIGGIILLVVLALVFGRKTEAPLPPPKTQVSFWGFAEDESAWKGVIAQYEASRPTVTINFVPVNQDGYEANLINNLAAVTGPDIFPIHYDWLGRHQNKVSALPSAYGTAQQIAEIFPKTISEDLVVGDSVYALPISMNTMALVYNRDYFDAKGVPSAPQSWADIQNLIPKLREVSGGKIVRSAIAIGGAEKNVKNAADLLTLIMMQNGVFGDTQNNSSILGGVDSLKFYLDFSDPKSKNFAFYDGTAANSLDVFAGGNSAMAFVYPQDLAYIKSKNQVSNYRVVPMPQLNPNKPVNLTDYWGLTVGKRAANADYAWDFVAFATMNENAVKTYAAISGSQPALRSVILSYEKDPILGVFAPQILNAVSFPKNNRSAFRSIIDNMIESSLKDRATIGANVVTADQRIRSIAQ